MKVRALRQFKHPKRGQGVVFPPAVVDVTASQGKDLVDRGYAEEVDKKEAPKAD